MTVSVDVDEIEARVSALQAATADLVDLPWARLPLDLVEGVVAGVESVLRTLSMVGCNGINRLHQEEALGRGRRLRDHLANSLHVSATEAGARIATAADLAGAEPELPETAAALRYGLVGAEHVRIIRDTIAKLPTPQANPTVPVSIWSWQASPSPNVPKCSAADGRSA